MFCTHADSVDGEALRFRVSVAGVDSEEELKRAAMGRLCASSRIIARACVYCDP